MELNSKPLCFVTVCTYNRPKGLEKALFCINKLIIPDGLHVEVLVVDNNPSKESQKVFFNATESLDTLSHYVTEPNRGIVNARNTALRHAQNENAKYLAFFDDDDYPHKNWLLEHWYCMEKYHATVTVGAMNYIWQADSSLSEEIKRIYDGAFNSLATGTVMERCYSGNTMIHLDFVSKNKLKFHKKFNLSGGEDSHFFEHMASLGAKIVWCNEAVVNSVVDENRTNENYIFTRRFNVGYNSFRKDVLLKGYVMAIAISSKKCFDIALNTLTRSNKYKQKVWLKRQWAEARGRICAMIGIRFEKYSETDGH
ncbi:MAG: glycosyltransferase family 2 protein [Ekhidna sp.]|nr:glycosyltransferase family 2 protein [Ekhidna sp.]